MTEEVSHRIAGDFNASTVCGIPKEHWKNATTEWDWVNCPVCLENRNKYTLITDIELREKILSITGHTGDINEALDEMDSMKTAIAELFDDNQALEILNRRLRVCLTLAETVVTTVQNENAMFLTEKTRGKINQFMEQYAKLLSTITLSKEIIEN